MLTQFFCMKEEVDFESIKNLILSLEPVSPPAREYKKSPLPCDKTGDLVKRRLPTLPLAQYHRRDEA